MFQTIRHSSRHAPRFASASNSAPFGEIGLIRDAAASGAEAGRTDRVRVVTARVPAALHRRALAIPATTARPTELPRPLPGPDRAPAVRLGTGRRRRGGRAIRRECAILLVMSRRSEQSPNKNMYDDVSESSQRFERGGA